MAPGFQPLWLWPGAEHPEWLTRRPIDAYDVAGLLNRYPELAEEWGGAEVLMALHAEDVSGNGLTCAYAYLRQWYANQGIAYPNILWVDPGLAAKVIHPAGLLDGLADLEIPEGAQLYQEKD